MDPNALRVRHVVGCMTGTSLDGLDAALTKITGTGLDMTAEFVGIVSAPLPDPLRTTLLSMANGEPHPPIEYMRAARYLGVIHAEAIAELLATHASDATPDFVVAHGQTIWHAPADRLSWQLFDPWPIVRSLKLPVCYDLRQADLVAGGEGAPITPIADWAMYRNASAVTAVVNLGGIANGTILYGDDWQLTSGADIGLCNLVVDGLIQKHDPTQKYDVDGQISLSGDIDPEVIEQLQSHAGLSLDISEICQSLGREVLSADWIDTIFRLIDHEHIWFNDLMASACSAIGQRIGAWVEKEKPSRLILAGGGIRNAKLVEQIYRYCDLGESWMSRSDDLGIPCEAREAMGFAVLGALSADGVPITLPQVTGAENPGVAGAWAYPDGPPQV